MDMTDQQQRRVRVQAQRFALVHKQVNPTAAATTMSTVRLALYGSAADQTTEQVRNSVPVFDTGLTVHRIGEPPGNFR